MISILLKGWSGNESFLSILYPIPALIVPFPALATSLLALITPLTVNIFHGIEATKVPNDIPRNSPSYF